MPQGLLDQVWFFLLILEAIHALTDFRGYLCCINVGGGVRGKKKKKITAFCSEKEKAFDLDSLF